jgi:tRNA (mo5U34)-methyltransferase
MSVYEVPGLAEGFDLVLFMGVLYHLRYPLLALDLLRRYVVRRMLVFQSMLRGSGETPQIAPDYAFTDVTPFETASFPRLFFVEHKYAGDGTNWWIPNRAAAAAMLRSAGFVVTAEPEEEVFVCEPAAPPARSEGEELPWSKP